MIVTSKTLSGKSKYFDEKGNEVPIRRERGRGGNRLPDIAMFYLTPGPRKAPELLNVDSVQSRSDRRKEIQQRWREEFRKAGRKAAAPKKQSVRDRISTWFKKWFSWLTKKR